MTLSFIPKLLGDRRGAGDRRAVDAASELIGYTRGLIESIPSLVG